MSRKTTDRFEREFAPRLVALLRELLGPRIQIAMIAALPGMPTRIHLDGAAVEPVARYPYALNVDLTWDLEEIEYLFEADGEAKFAHYLESLPRKLGAWQGAREIDFVSRSQGEAHILLGGLDFIG